MKRNDRPSMYFVGAVLRAFNKAEAKGEVTCSAIWTHMCAEAVLKPGAFLDLFLWDTGKAKSKNRVRTIGECISRGHVPGLAVDDQLKVVRMEE